MAVTTAFGLLLEVEAHLSVTKQVCGCARVEQGSENLSHGFLHLFLKDITPLSVMGLSAFYTGIGNILRQVRQELIQVI